MALALVLLIGSGLMIRTFQSLRRVQPGFSEPAALQTLRIAIAGDAAADDAKLLVMQQNLVNRLASIPGVSSVSLMNGLPMTGFMSQDPIFASDHSYARQPDSAAAPLHPRRSWRLPGAGHAAARRP